MFARCPLALRPRERRGVDREDHRDRGLVDAQRAGGGRGLGRGDGLADLDAFEAGEGHDLAARGGVGLDPLQAVEDVELASPWWSRGALSRLATRHRVAHPDAAREDAADAEAAEVVAVVEVRDQELQHAVGGAGGGGDRAHQRVEQRPQVVTRARGWAFAMPALAFV